MTALLIINYDIADAEQFGEYQGAAGAALDIGGGTGLAAFDSASDSIEGSPGHQTVVLRFESKEKAREVYDSGDYQAVLPTRFAATTNHFAVLVDEVS